MRLVWRQLSRTLAAVTCLVFCGAICQAQSIDCPVIASAGSVHADGTVTVLGQLAVGVVADENTTLDQGAVPCWAARLCPGDLNGDMQVGLPDLAQLLGSYGITSGATYEDGDLDEDGDVDLGDLAELLGLYGTICS